MQELRAACDKLEHIMPEAKWPMPTYADLLYRI
jgi:glutamine synthetase type III